MNDGFAGAMNDGFVGAMNDGIGREIGGGFVGATNDGFLGAMDVDFVGAMNGSFVGAMNDGFVGAFTGALRLALGDCTEPRLLFDSRGRPPTLCRSSISVPSPCPPPAARGATHLPLPAALSHAVVRSWH